jgi:4-amino-4-deoxy-L-arabinose transferase-like glycosyltransferase
MKTFLARHKKALIYLMASVVTSFLGGLFLELFELPDGFFYVALAQYIFTGIQAPISPFNLVNPQTLFAPMYGFFTYPFMILRWPWGLILIPLLQLFLYFLSGLLVYKTLRIFFSYHWAVAGLVLFILFPFGLVYATVLMSETLGVFFISLYLYLLVQIITKKKSVHPSYLFFLSCVAGLTRYPFILLVPLSCLVWIWKTRKIGLKTSFRPVSIFLALAGLTCIALWINFNHSIHDRWILTSYTGRHLYNNVVHSARLTPPQNDPIWKEFLTRLPKKERLYDPEWVVQPWFATDFRAGKLTEIDIDRIFLRFSIRAILHQPFSYVAHVFKTALGNITSPPYHTGLLSQLGLTDSSCPTCIKQACRIAWNSNMCSPLVTSPVIDRLWGSAIVVWLSFYPFGTLLLFIFAITGGIFGIINKKRVIILIWSIFLFFIFLQASLQQIEGRYIIPTYPLYILLIIYGIHEMHSRITKK